MIKLNLGGGYIKIEGFKNVDNRKETKPDYYADLEEKGCLKAIKTNSVDEIIASHVLEHIRNIEILMAEIYRVSVDGGKILIRVPYWNHQTAVEDPTHVRYFTERSMMYFCKDTTGSDGHKISIPYDFVLEEVVLVAEPKYKKLTAPKLLEKAHELNNIIREVAFRLVVRKPKKQLK